MTLSMQITINDSALNPPVYRLECESFCMDEGISVPFRLETVFISENDYTGANIVGQTGWFYICQNNIGRTIGGVILEFRVLNKRDLNSYTYSIVLGPRLSLLEKTRQSEIMATQASMDLYTVLNNVLSGTMNNGATISNRGVTLDYTIHSSVQAGTFLRNNITKYNESDLNFFQRTCEKYGVFYYFQYNVTQLENNQINVTDTVLVASDNAAFANCAPATWTFKAPTNTVGASTDTSVENAANLGAVVFSLEYVARPVIQQFNLRNYSPATPFSVFGTSTPQQTNGIGGVVEYGEYFASSSEAETVATYRAQENAWQSSLFECRSTIASLATGQVFTLTGNPISSYNTQYVIVSARHEAGRRGPLGYSANYPTTPYSNSFTAIESTLPFRPRRMAQKPVMSGVYNAFVQATESTAGTPQPRSVMDQYGQYLVGFVYNEAGNKSTPGQGSAPIRQVQPYASSGTDQVVSGMQLPLVSNAEVLVGYVNGDPDQPIIMGSAFNQTNTNVVNNNADTVNRLRTTGGLLLEMNDGATSSSPPSPRYVRFDVPQNITDAPPGAMPDPVPDPAPTATGHYLRLGNSASDSVASSQLLAYSSTVQQVSQSNKNEDSPFTEKASSSKTSTTKSQVTQTSTAPSQDGLLIFSQSTLDMNVQGAGLMKFGAGHTTQVQTGDSVHTVSSGQYTMTTLNGITMTGGNSGNPADVLIHAYNTVTTKSEGDTYDWIYGKQTKYTEGTSVTYFNGFAYTCNKSLQMTYQLGGTLTLTTGLASTLIVGAKVDLILGAKVDMVIGKPVKMATMDEYRMKTAEAKINGLVTSITGGVKSGVTGIGNYIAAIRARSAQVNANNAPMDVEMTEMHVGQGAMNVQMNDLDVHA